MKPTTQGRIDRAVFDIDNLCYDEGHDVSLRAILEMLMKEQDRDTRHACAEAVSALKYRRDPNGRDSGGDYIVWQSHAHAACINVQAV